MGVEERGESGLKEDSTSLFCSFFCLENDRMAGEAAIVLMPGGHSHVLRMEMTLPSFCLLRFSARN